MSMPLQPQRQKPLRKFFLSMNRYLTTTLPYVNADPHVGHALEFVQADALARVWRLQGDEVFFTTGADEHGQKIWEAAQKAGQGVQEYVNHFSNEMQKLKEVLNLSNDAFIRTTDPKHYAAAQEMWRRCDAAGDIYKKSYTGLYCVGCEAYKTEKDLNDEGHCLIHPHLMLEEITEENYFFRLSKYQDALVAYLSDPSRTIPDWRRLEALNFVQGGLEDFSISREKARLSWGILVPGDDSQVMYVWFDALTNYISVLGWSEDTKEDNGGNFEKFWQEGETLQVAGKDQVRFQSIMWQAILMSAQIKNTDKIFYHGFINSGGQKMSKSIGNVISPYELVAKYGTDATRYFFLRHVHPTDDSDMTWEKLDEWYTANLVNGLGNLVARVMKLAEDHLEKPVELSEGYTDVSPFYLELVQQFAFGDALDAVFVSIGHSDEHMTTQEPFKKIKNPETADEAREIITKLVCEIAKIATDLQWAMPETSEKILTAVKENKKPENLFPRLGVR
jgi:methionyl-tRNA synthetase